MLITNFEYRKYKPGDEAGIVALLKKSFAKWSKRSIEYWKWKYLKSPHGIWVYLILDGDKIIGVICYLAINIKLGDQIIISLYGDDTTTDSDYRGKGIYKNLVSFSHNDLLANELRFQYYKTENPIISKTGSSYNDLIFPFSLLSMIKIKDLNKYLKNTDRDTLKNKMGLILLKGANSLGNFAPRINRGEKDFSINSVKRFDKKINLFWDRVKDNYNFIIEKKEDYLNWRYCSNSDQYYIRLATKGEEILGFSVLYYSEDEVDSEGSIIDLLALKERPDVTEYLIDDAVTQFERLGANSIFSQTIKDLPYKKLLAKKGFIDVSIANKNFLYYNPNDCSGFDPKTFSEYDPKSIYFNLY